MSHDKKKPKKGTVDTHVPVEAVAESANGAVKTVQKGSGDVKTGAKNSGPDTKKGSNSKKR
jgi:hypothetical protein